MASLSRPPTPTATPPRDPKDWRFKTISAPTEWVENYRPGGFHPVHIGDRLGDRGYTVIAKLGYGAFSTVWLAHDEQREAFVAVKVTRAHARGELDQLRISVTLVAEGIEDTRNHVVLPIDHFTLPGPNGEHQCLVFEAMGPNVGFLLDGCPILSSGTDWFDPMHAAMFDQSHVSTSQSNLNVESESFPALTLAQRKTLIKQLLLGLNCLHQSRVAHGDLNPGNLLLKLRPLTLTDRQRITDPNLHCHKLAPVERRDGKQDPWAPRYIYVERSLAEWIEREPMQAKLADLGSAFKFDHPPSAEDCAAPTGLRGPEIILNDSITEKIDIWAFGCLLFYLLTRRALFTVWGFMATRDDIDDDHLLMMTRTLGQLPPELFARWPRRRKYFDANMDYIPPLVNKTVDEQRDETGNADAGEENYTTRTLEEQWQEAVPGGMDEKEAGQVLILMRRILQYDPALRPTTAQLLDDEWFKAI